MLAAADGAHYLDLVAFAERDIFEFFAADYRAVMGDGNEAGVDLKLLKEGNQWRRRFEGALFAIYGKCNHS